MSNVSGAQARFLFCGSTAAAQLPRFFDRDADERVISGAG